MADVTTPQGLPLWSDYTAFARRHARWIGLLVLAGLLTGAGWSLRQPATYSATTSVALTAVPKYVTPSTSGLLAPAVTVDTDAQLLQSPQVLGALADVLGTSPAEALAHLSVAASPNTRVLHVTVSSTSPELAAAASGAAVDALVNLRREVLGALAVDQLRQLQALVATQEALLGKQQARALVVPARDELFGDLLELRRGLDELQEARARPGLVVQTANPPRARDYPNTEVPVVSGAMLGLLAGCLLGAHRDRRGHPVRTPASVAARRWRRRLTPRRPSVPLVLHKESHHA